MDAGPVTIPVSQRRGFGGCWRPAQALVLLLAAPVAAGQGLGLPDLPRPGLPRPELPPDLSPATRELDAATETVESARRSLVADLALRNPRRLELDPDGELILRGRIVAVDPSAGALRRLRAAGFAATGTRRFEGLGLRLVTLRAPRAYTTRAALDEARALDPGGSYDFVHLYQTAGTTAGSRSEAAPAVVERSNPTPEAALRLGMIDAGVADHPALTGVAIERWGCSGQPQASAHGTATAALLSGIGEIPAPGRELFAADVYCDRATGGDVAEIAAALDWLVRADVRVISMAIVGPPNTLLERAVERAAAESRALVAAAGNDGPRADPLYPAAYDEVIAVTGVNRRRRVLPEAAQGPHIMFAAPGSDLVAADDRGGYSPVRGTSFAAPVVARLLALEATEAAGREEWTEALVARAEDLGDPGRDTVFGYGLVGQAAWNTPR